MRHFLGYCLETGVVSSGFVDAFCSVPSIPTGTGLWCAASPHEWEYGCKIENDRLVLSDIQQRQDPRKSELSLDECMMNAGLYQSARRDAYDPLPEQLDRITKALAALREAGIDIGHDGDEQVNHCHNVKNRFPKPLS